MKNFSIAKKILTVIGAVAFWVLIWAGLHRHVGQEILLVSPVRAIERLIELAVTPLFWGAVYSTFSRVAEGFGMAVLAGGMLAIITSHSALLERLFAPILASIRATPVASVIILALVWLATARIPVFIVFLMVTPIVWTNLYTGFGAVDIQLLEMAKVFRFSLIRKIRYIYLPALMPYFAAACATGIGAAWKSAIAAEVIARPAGSMGRHIYNSRIYLQTADLFAWTIGVILLSVALEKLASRLIDYFSRKISGQPKLKKEARRWG